MTPDRRLPPEIRLVLCCARTRIDASTRAMVADLLKEDLDWPFVERFALEHRVMPLLHHGLASLDVDAIPASLMVSLRGCSETTATSNLAWTCVLLEALDALAREGIPVIPFKGPVLAISAYGRLELRKFNDLDLLVRERDADRARTVFASLGYFEIRKKLTWETEFRRADAAIDLHWRIAPARMVDYWIGFEFDLDAAWRRVETIRVLGHEIACFSPEDALLAHCQSSLKNGFNRSLARLRWICDIAEMIRAHPNLEWDTLMERAKAARTRRAMFVCLDLAYSLLGAPVPGGILRTIRKDPVAGYLRRKLAHRYLCVDPWRPVALAEQFLYAGLLQDRMADRLPYLWRCARGLVEPNQKDREFIHLPDRFKPLYYVVRPVRLSVALLRRQNVTRASVRRST